MSGDVVRRGLRGAAWLLPAAIVLIALNFRGPIVATAPVIGDVRADLGLTATIAGLLTTIPVLCFALATPFASWVIAKADPERAVSLSLVIVLVGTVVRSMPSSAALLIGTAVIGIGITIGNVVIPVVIRRDTSPERVGLVTGVYTSALNVGSMITSLGTAPLAALWGWPVAIAIWAVFALIAGARLDLRGRCSGRLAPPAAVRAATNRCPSPGPSTRCSTPGRSGPPAPPRPHGSPPPSPSDRRDGSSRGA